MSQQAFENYARLFLFGLMVFLGIIIVVGGLRLVF